MIENSWIAPAMSAQNQIAKKAFVLRVGTMMMAHSMMIWDGGKSNRIEGEENNAAEKTIW
jgi:hypothetical protein